MNPPKDVVGSQHGRAAGCYELCCKACYRANTGNERSSVDNPFQKICTPIQTSRNDDSLMITLIAVAPNAAASRSANA